MGSRSLGACPPQARRSAVLDSIPALPAGAPHLVARVLAVLVGRSVGEDEVLARAVSLGLLRQPPPNQLAWFPAQALARLFLAGYRLPAHVEAGTVTSLRGHLAAGRSVFVLLQDPDGQGADGELLQVECTAGDLGFVVGSTGSEGRARLLTPEAFSRAWAGAGNFLIAAQRQWAELPAEGRSFFGGSREADGTYHWDTAECATDATGRILQC
jgi:hypothetical protein